MAELLEVLSNSPAGMHAVGGAATGGGGGEAGCASELAAQHENLKLGTSEGL